ncbi:hypothetical protein CYY_004215 [Polysphondylium violaceum]|uniref:Uncharacterized protein n=1 Tax=Polysphondylium violaceum TaxID=133409 RepID=A0A8J4PVL5_9MYCE|nr:hypothetical protein CYY_004215 [Polysphondylium violaceum]
MAPKVDMAVLPLVIILGITGVCTAGFGVYRLSTDNDMALSRRRQMLFINNNTPKMVDRETTMKFYNEIHNGKFLRS